MFQHVLVPLDGSRVAEAVLGVVSELARRAHARVTLLHVLEKDPPSEIHGDRHLTKAEEAHEYLRQMAREFPDGIPVSQHVHDPTIRHVPQSLVDHVNELGADLVVLRAHGVHRGRDLIFGNIAQQMAGRGTTPVLLLGPAIASGSVLPFYRILVPLDWRPEHAAGLDPAKALAVLSGASLDLLTVVPTPEHLPPQQAFAGQLMPATTRELLEMAESDGAVFLENLVQQLRTEGYEVAGHMLRGDPCERIADFFQAEKIDTIALGTHGRAGTDAFWSGSLAQKLVRRVPASFLLKPVGTRP